MCLSVSIRMFEGSPDSVLVSFHPDLPMLSLVLLQVYLVSTFSLFSLRQFLPDNTLLWNINSLWMLPVAHLAMVTMCSVIGQKSIIEYMVYAFISLYTIVVPIIVFINML